MNTKIGFSKVNVFAGCITLGFVVGCGTGYQVENGKWSYVTWDEGHGYRNTPLEVHGDLRVFNNPRYAADDNRAFLDGVPIRGADGSSFEHLAGGVYFRDCRSVFYHGVLVQQADPETFSCVRIPYGVDSNHFFCGTIPFRIKNDVKFRVLKKNELCFRFPDGQRFYQWYGDEYDGLPVDLEMPCVIGWGKIQIGDELFRGPIKIGNVE